ncbi:MAG: ribosome assembly cofactor RimP [Rikenellaceae bacterium]|nr:ribosome assembly cofactor RimP [Rikenellaceae bacterium]
MIDVEKIRKITEDFVEGTDMFVVDIKCSPTNVVDVVLDSESSVSIDKCVELSREVNSRFDRDVEDFELTVSSAGIGQPFRHPKQYIKALGKDVEIVLKNGIKYEGRLTDVGDDELEIEYQEKQLIEGKKRKQLISVNKRIGINDIKSTIQLLRFK